MADILEMSYEEMEKLSKEFCTTRDNLDTMSTDTKNREWTISGVKDNPQYRKAILYSDNVF